MTPPIPGADPASRLFGYATPADGAGPVGPDGHWPQPIGLPFSEVMKGLNPLHHLPGVGTIYRAATGETIAPPLQILGAGIFGGPMGMLSSALLGLFQTLFTLGPDTSRPPTPLGMSETGSETGMQPVTPGGEPGGYTTLATVPPEFLRSPTMLAGGDGARGFAAYGQAEQEWRWSEAVEKGVA